MDFRCKHDKDREIELCKGFLKYFKYQKTNYNIGNNIGLFNLNLFLILSLI
jgi:hypothetical protein